MEGVGNFQIDVNVVVAKYRVLTALNKKVPLCVDHGLWIEDSVLMYSPIYDNCTGSFIISFMMNDWKLIKVWI